MIGEIENNSFIVTKNGNWEKFDKLIADEEEYPTLYDIETWTFSNTNKFWTYEPGNHKTKLYLHNG